MRLRRLIASALAVFLYGSGLAYAAELRIGGAEVAPFVTGEPNEPIGGVLVDFIKQKVLPGTGIETRWLPPMSAGRAAVSLREGSLDIVLLADVGKDQELDRIGKFDWTVLDAKPHLAVRPDSPLQSVQSLSQLQGMRIGWIRMKTPDEFADVDIEWHLLNAPNWQQINLRKLAVGRLDAAYFSNQYSARHVAAAEGLQMRLIPLPMPAHQMRMLYSLKGDQQAIGRFEKAAAAAFANGKFQKFLEDRLARPSN